MPSTQVLVPPTADTALASLALLKKQVRADSGEEDDLLQVYLDAAREMVEGETCRYYGAHTLAITFRLDEPYKLPVGATALTVSGAFTTLDALENIPAYVEEYRKGISINRELPLSTLLEQEYTVVATTPGDTQYAGLAKRVTLALAADFYRNREVTPLSAQWRVELAPARTNVLGIS